MGTVMAQFLVYNTENRGGLMGNIKLCRHCFSRFEPVEGVAEKVSKDECFFSSIRYDASKIRMKVGA